MGAPWTEAENADLQLGAIVKTPAKVLAKQLPGRTPLAVERQMVRLGLRRGNCEQPIVHSKAPLPKELYKRARALARERNTPWPDFIRSLVEKELAQQ